MRAVAVGSSALSFAMALCLSACTPFPQRDRPASLHDFGFRWNHNKQGDAPWSKVVVEAPEWLQDERIRYRLLYNEPTRVRFYTRDRWLAPPPSLLTQRLTAASSNACRMASWPTMAENGKIALMPDVLNRNFGYPD